MAGPGRTSPANSSGTQPLPAVTRAGAAMGRRIRSPRPKALTTLPHSHYGLATGLWAPARQGGAALTGPLRGQRALLPWMAPFRTPSQSRLLGMAGSPRAGGRIGKQRHSPTHHTAGRGGQLSRSPLPSSSRRPGGHSAAVTQVSLFLCYWRGSGTLGPRQHKDMACRVTLRPLALSTKRHLSSSHKRFPDYCNK